MQSTFMITVNGQQREVRSGASLAELVVELGLSSAAIAVEKNHKLVRPRDHAATALERGDEIEVVTLVGGG